MGQGGLPNSPAPLKRSLHTLSILLSICEGKCIYVIGCAGGDLRPQIHVEVLTNIADYDMELSKVIDYPRYMLTQWNSMRINAIIEKI